MIENKKCEWCENGLCVYFRVLQAYYLCDVSEECEFSSERT